MTTAKSTKTSKTAAKAPTNTDNDQPTTTTPDTAAETPAQDPAACPASQPDVEPARDCPMGNSASGEAGEDPGPNMTEQDYEALHGLPAKVNDDNASGEHPPIALLTAERIGLTPKQHVTAIIAGGVISGMLARSKPYDPLDLHKAAETIGMCDTLVDMILHLDDPMPEAPDEQSNS